jgi:hypothetical protein
VERKYMKKNLSEWNFVKWKSHTDWPRIETGPKTHTNLNCVQRPSPYRAVNTFRLGYNNQSVDVV